MTKLDPTRGYSLGLAVLLAVAPASADVGLPDAPAWTRREGAVIPVDAPAGVQVVGAKGRVHIFVNDRTPRTRHIVVDRDGRALGQLTDVPFSVVTAAACDGTIALAGPRQGDTWLTGGVAADGTGGLTWRAEVRVPDKELGFFAMGCAAGVPLLLWGTIHYPPAQTTLWAVLLDGQRAVSPRRLVSWPELRDIGGLADGPTVIVAARDMSQGRVELVAVPPRGPAERHALDLPERTDTAKVARVGENVAAVFTAREQLFLQWLSGRFSTLGAPEPILAVRQPTRLGQPLLYASADQLLILQHSSTRTGRFVTLPGGRHEPAYDFRQQLAPYDVRLHRAADFLDVGRVGMAGAAWLGDRWLVVQGGNAYSPTTFILSPPASTSGRSYTAPP